MAGGFEGGLAVVILAIFLDRLTAALARQPSHGVWAMARRSRSAEAARAR